MIVEQPVKLTAEQEAKKEANRKRLEEVKKKRELDAKKRQEMEEDAEDIRQMQVRGQMKRQQQQGGQDR